MTDTAGQQRFWRALGVGHVPVRFEMQRCHPLAVGIKRNLVEPGRLLTQPGRLQTGAHGHLIQGDFGRVADQLAGGIRPRIVVQQQRSRQARRRFRPQRLQALASHPERLGPHAVLRQGAGLVRTDEGDRPQGFDGRQSTDQGVLFDHAAGPQGQRHGRHCRQCLGNGRHGQTDGGQQHQDRLLAAQQPDPENDGADRQHQQRQPLPELGEPLLQRGLGFLFLPQQLGDLAQFRVKARCDHDARPAPIGGHGALVGHVGAIPQRRIQLSEQHIHLFHRLGFPGQGRLLDLQARHIKQPQVSRDDIAGLQHDQIARDQLAGWYRVQLALAQYLRGGAGQPPERRDGALRPVFLHKADDRVQHHDDDDGDGVGNIPEQA